MWLDEIEEYIPELTLDGETLYDLSRMARVLRSLVDLIRHIDMCQECADTTYKDCAWAVSELSKDAKELLG